MSVGGGRTGERRQVNELVMGGGGTVPFITKEILFFSSLREHKYTPLYYKKQDGGWLNKASGVHRVQSKE